jgi:hypothetical protein
METIDEIGERQTEINITSMKVYNGQEDKRHAKHKSASFSNGRK